MALTAKRDTVDIVVLFGEEIRGRFWDVTFRTLKIVNVIKKLFSI